MLPITSLLPPLLLALVVRPLSFNTVNYLPAGPTPLLFALLAQYHAAIPHVYKYRLATSSSSSSSGPSFSDKSYTYLLAAQLALSHFPGSTLCAAAGWAVGYLWRNEVLPARLVAWRVPAWAVGAAPARRGEGFEALRRRLEGEGAGTGVAGEGGPRRRTLGRQVLDQFRGAF